MPIWSGTVFTPTDRDEPRTPDRMAAALHRLLAQARPSEVVVPGLLDGLDRIRGRLKLLLREPRPFRLSSQAAERPSS